MNRIFNAKTWSFRQRRTTFATVASTARYNLPKTVGLPYIVQSTGEPKKIEFVGEEEFDFQIPDPLEVADPRVATIYDLNGVSEQPSSASVIAISSSSNADTSQIVRVRGLVGGQETSENISLNGTSGVNGLLSFSEIIAVTKSAETTGNITLTSNSAAVTNVVIGPLETTVKFRQMRLYPTPASVLTITVKHFAPPPILTHIYDDIQIPQTWDYVTDQFAFALALQAKGQDQASEFTTQYALAKQFLDEDMATEERAAVHVPLIARRAGDTGDLTPAWLPSGHGFLG